MLNKEFNKKKISQKLEKKLAKKLGGKTTISSGNQFYDPSDIKWKEYLIEHKFTTKDSYRITKTVLEKNNKESISQGKMPVLIVEFIDKSSEKILESYVIMFSELLIESNKKESFNLNRENLEDFFILEKKNFKILKLEEFLQQEG